VYIRNTGQLKLHILRTLDVATKYCEVHTQATCRLLPNRECTDHINLHHGVYVLGLQCMTRDLGAASPRQRPVSVN